MEGYGRSVENLSILDKLRREIGIFNKKFITITLRNSIDFWLCHEPITLIFDIQNRGRQLEDTTISLDLSQNVEPIGATEICLPKMHSLGKTSFALQVIPRLDGEYPCLFNAFCLDSDLQIKSIHSKLVVAPKYTTQVRTQSQKDTPNFERLKRVLSIPNAKKKLGSQNIDNIEKLATIDLAACLNKIRSAAEHLSQGCTNKAGLRFSDQIRKIQKENLLSQKSVGYLHIMRMLGNLASHPSGETITLDDVQVSTFALSCVLEEILSKEI